MPDSCESGLSIPIHRRWSIRASVSTAGHGIAISTLAGATLLEHAAISPIVRDIVPFVKGLTLFFWAIASWWLIVLGVWRYLICGLRMTRSTHVCRCRPIT